MHGKMKNNILVTINNLSDIERFKELGITKYVFYLKDFSVGIPNTFLLSEIKDEGYIFINRILDNEGIDKLKDVLKDIPKNIKGIIFDDLGVYEIIKDLDLEKILYLSHFNTNSESIGIYLDMVSSVVVSTDITKDEIEKIVLKYPDKLTLFVYGYISVMYSRRYLIDNYSKFHNIKKENPLEIQNNNNKFIVYENDYGTVIYYDKIFNGMELLKYPCKYYFINGFNLSFEDIKDALDGLYKEEKEDKGFLYKETIYKLKEGE